VCRRERQFKVAIKLASRADIHHLQEFLRGRQHDIPQETIQALDVVLRALPSEMYVCLFILVIDKCIEFMNFWVCMY
jgi:hypothetical protein